LNHSSIVGDGTFLDESDLPSLMVVNKDSLVVTKVDTYMPFGEAGIISNH
jgi:hypothetical protein